MNISVTAANEIFDILISKGHFDVDESIDYMRAEFVERFSNPENNSGEYWYPSKHGSSFKLYFSQEFAFVEGGTHVLYNKVSFVAQTFNPTYEKNVVQEVNDALMDINA